MHIATGIVQYLNNLQISQIQMHCHNPCCLAVHLRFLGEWKLPQPDAEPHKGHFLKQRLLG